jgi:hypothetical protein
VKKIVALVVVGLVLAALARNSPHFSVYRLKQGLEAGDLNLVVQHADLAKFAELPVDVSVELASMGMKETAGVLGESLAKLLGGAVGATVKQVGSQAAAQALRTRIEQRDLLPLLGGFEPLSGFGWYGGIQMLSGDAAILTVVGTCDSKAQKGERLETRLGIDLMKSPGPWLGFPWDWRAMGVELNSMKQVLRDCRLSF